MSSEASRLLTPPTLGTAVSRTTTVLPCSRLPHCPVQKLTLHLKHASRTDRLDNEAVHADSAATFRLLTAPGEQVKNI